MGIKKKKDKKAESNQHGNQCRGYSICDGGRCESQNRVNHTDKQATKAQPTANRALEERMKRSYRNEAEIHPDLASTSLALTPAFSTETRRVEVWRKARAVVCRPASASAVDSAWRSTITLGIVALDTAQEGKAVKPDSLTENGREACCGCVTA